MMDVNVDSPNLGSTSLNFKGPAKNHPALDVVRFQDFISELGNLASPCWTLWLSKTFCGKVKLYRRCSMISITWSPGISVKDSDGKKKF